MKVWLFLETLQPKYGNLFGRFFVQNSGYTSFIRRFSHFATGLSQVVENSIAAARCQQLATARPVENSIAAALSQQLATGLLKTALLQLDLPQQLVTDGC
jgi:hypothetical protein